MIIKIRPKLLYIDDSKDYLEEMGALLQEEFDVVTLSNSLNAIEYVLKESPQIILLDVYMPFQDGPSTLRKIRELPGEQGRTPILFISSDDQDKTVINCFDVGGVDFISRSLSSGQIVARIKSKLSRKNSKIVINKNSYLNPFDGNLYYKEECLALTPNEFRLLSFTAESNFMISKKELIEKVWPDAVVLEKTINTHLTNLRKKISHCDFSISILRNGNVCLEWKTAL